MLRRIIQHSRTIKKDDYNFDRFVPNLRLVEQREKYFTESEEILLQE